MIAMIEALKEAVSVWRVTLVISGKLTKLILDEVYSNPTFVNKIFVLLPDCFI